MRLAFPLAIALLVTEAAADSAHVVRGARVHLGDVLSGLPAEAASVDLGPAPPPGSTRLISRAEIVARLQEAHLASRVAKVPASVRVEAASKKLSPTEVADLSRDLVTRGLRAGVKLVKIETTSRLTVAPDVTVKEVVVGKLPRQAGQVRLGATALLSSGDEVVARVPLTLLLDVGPEAARAEVPRGSRVSLIVQRGSVRVSTSGVALNDADAGDVVGFSVAATGRVLRARVLSADTAEVVEAN